MAPKWNPERCSSVVSHYTPDYLELNQSFISSRPPDDTAYYQPMVWTHFGGRGGDLLSHLTRIEGIVISNTPERLFQIKFHYGGGGTDSRRVETIGGHCRPGYTYITRTVNFAIDGPGGEFITGIDLLYDPWLSVHRPKGNRKRSLGNMQFCTIQVSARFLNLSPTHALIHSRWADRFIRTVAGRKFWPSIKHCSWVERRCALILRKPSPAFMLVR
jgi:hypothetical protein